MFGRVWREWHGTRARAPSSLLVVVVGGFLGNVYLKAQVNIKREMSLRKAPIVSQIGVVLAGLRETFI